MKAEQLKKVVEHHRRLIDLSNRGKVTYTCQFVEDLLKEELQYLKEHEPMAFNTIANTEKAIEVVRDLGYDIDDMETDDLVKEQIWN